MSTMPENNKEKYIIIVTVIIIFIAAGLIAVFSRACGGDKPAPVAITQVAYCIRAAR
jgi:ascorbate-specific PTS system EIIC-type component UlaA